MHRFLSILLLLSAPLNAAKIDHALEAPQKWNGKVFRSDIRPTWLDVDRLWYRVQTGPKNYGYVLVNAVTGERKTAATREGIGLPAGERLKTSQSKERLHSSTNGSATKIAFFNRLEKPVKMVWVDPDGEQHDYSTVPKDGEFHQNTFAGHVWLVKDDLNKPMAVVTAVSDTMEVDIDGLSPGMRELVEPPAAGPGVRSPDGKWTAYVERGKVMLKGSLDAKPAHLKTSIEARSPFQGGISWAPDSSRFVVSSAVSVLKRKITLIDSSPKNQIQPRRKDIDYPKPGDPLPQPFPVIFKLKPDGYDYKVVKPDRFATQFIQTDRLEVRWSRDSREFYFDYNQRGHQRYCIIGVDAGTAESRVVVEETSRTFIDYTRKTWRHWLEKSNELIWMSERDGWCHLWLYDVPEGKVKHQVTQGAWVVRNVERVDEAGHQIWFMASGLKQGEDPYHEHLCRINFDGTGFRQMTEADGQHSIEWSPDKKYFIATWSRADHPPVTELRRSEDGRLVCILEKADAAALLETGWTMPERFVAKGRDGKTEIHGLIIKPSAFDPAKKYPVVEQVYAGPHSAFTPKEFGVLARYHEMAEAGFIVVQADGMGTNHRGKAFHDVCWKNLKDAGFPDRIAWIKAAAQTRPWMDLQRVGIFGGSAGGQSAMRALLDHNDFYQAAVADCGCHDNRMDKIWWNEQWMGWPIDKSYSENSNVDDAGKLQGNLLLIVGELDVNVDPATTYQVVNALQKAGRPFEFMPMIGIGHGAAETPYGTRLRMEFLMKHLRP